MYRPFFSLLVFILFGLHANAQSQYEATFSLKDVAADKLDITVEVPDIKGKKAKFIFPKVVPGTYEQSDYGRFIEDFSAYSASGRKLRVRKMDVNSYMVRKSHKVKTVRYLVNDTWDQQSENYIFQPGGNNFEAGESFVLNPFGLFGYFNDYVEGYPYQLTIEKPQSFYGATSLDRIETTADKDVFWAENYVELVDQPLLYSVPDTTSYYEDGARVVVAVVSPEPEINAQLVKEWVQPLTEATNFVLGNIPTDEYWFLMHFFNWSDPDFMYGGGAYGALEHKKSSLYYLPTYKGAEGADLESVKGAIDDMATHEFLHILSPLNLHSEEIAYFDFYDTELSKHLWLYEGVTEYLSMKSLLIGGVTDMDEFIEDIILKIKYSKRYKEMSFTEMSKNIIEPEYHTEYGNVYQKGALLAMMLDIKTAQVTDGEMDLIDLVLELIDMYGMGKPFKDDELFDVIADMTDPSVRDFFRIYFEGAAPLPMKEMLALAGLDYSTTMDNEQYSFGKYNMDFDANSGLLTVIPIEDNPVIPHRLDIQKLNGEDISFRNMRNYLMNPENDNDLVVDYVADGAVKQITLKPVLGDGEIEYTIQKMEDAGADQQRIYKKLFTADDR